MRLVMRIASHGRPPLVVQFWSILSRNRPEPSEDQSTGRGPGNRRRYALEKTQQLSNRQTPSLIRHVLEGFRKGSLTAREAAAQLDLSRSRLYELSTDYVR